MAKAVVSLFDSLDTARTARQRLLDSGFDDVRVRVVGPHPELASEPYMSKDVADPNERTSDKGGVAGVVARMLSGWLIEDRVSEYQEAVRGGKTLVALDVPDDAAAEQAARVLDEVQRADDRAARAEPDQVPMPEPTATLTRVQVYSLPNAPTDWGEATLGEKSAIDVLSDPGRPDGLVEDAGGLGSDDTDDAYAARKAAQRGQDSAKRQTARNPAPGVRREPRPRRKG